MAERRGPRTYHLARPDGVGFFRRWSARQAGVGLIGLFVALSALRLQGLVALRIAMVVAGTTVLGLGLGRSPGGEALIDLVVPFARFAWRQVRRRHLFVAPLSPLGGPAGAVPPFLGGLVLDDLDPVSLGRSGRRVGLIEDRSDATVALVLRVRGRGFTLADPEEKDARVGAFGQALADLCREQHPVVRISWTQWCAPAGTDEHRLWLDGAMRPDPHPEMVVAYEQVLERVAGRAQRIECLVTLSVAQARVKVAERHRGDRLAAAAERALEQAELFAAQLRRAELVVSGPLSAQQLARVLRNRLDPGQMSLLDARGRSLGDLAGLVSLHNAYPLVTEEARRHICCDAAVHRVLRVAEWPRGAVRSDWLRDLLATSGVTRSITVVYRPQSRRQSRFEVDSQASRTDGSIEEKLGKGHHVGASLRRASAAIEQIDDELEAGAGMQHFVGLVVVTATSTAELEQAAEQVTQVAANCGVELRCLDCRQGAGLVAALPLGRDVLEGRRA